MRAVESGRGSEINNKANKGLLVLVEPDSSVRDALVYLLEGRGWEVRAVEDCPDLLTAIANDQPLAVISESSLPDCSPGQILERCRKRDLPVIFIGHDLELQGAVDLIRDGALDYLDKPFHQGRLVNLLEGLYLGNDAVD